MPALRRRARASTVCAKSAPAYDVPESDHEQRRDARFGRAGCASPQHRGTTNHHEIVDCAAISLLKSDLGDLEFITEAFGYIPEEQRGQSSCAARLFKDDATTPQGALRASDSQCRRDYPRRRRPDPESTRGAWAVKRLGRD
jgi:hypothetical protein